ncbi:MAG: hypothetical protein ACKOLA_12180 [Spartobacteria bacterium]
MHKAVARCSSWEDFVEHLGRLSEKEKGDVFEHLVRALGFRLGALCPSWLCGFV